MDTLQKIFDKEIQESLTFSVVGTKFIKSQMEKKGITLTEKQIDEVHRKLKGIIGNSIIFNFDLDNEQLKALGISEGEKIDIDIGDDEEFDIFCQELIEELVGAAVNEMTESILASLKKDMPAMLKAQRKETSSFEKRLQSDWKKPFDLFETFLILAFEAGEEFNNKFREDESETGNYVFEVLTRLHARACQISSEVLVLLKSGFADGAHARWRSLHEIAVVAAFIKTHGKEVAERYLLHNDIESFKVASLHQKYSEILGVESFPQDEYESIKAVRDELIDRFGSAYKNHYGWAASVLNKGNPNFTDIEENSGLDHLRPYYKLASHNVHANSKGVMFKLGLFANTQNILLAGPSNYGFTEPAQGTAFSLGLVTITLITMRSTIDNLVLSNILLKLETEIGEEFFKIQKKIEDRETT